MTPEEFANLQPGDVVRGKTESQSYVVTAHYGTRVTAVRTVDMTSPAEWDLIIPHAPIGVIPQETIGALRRMTEEYRKHLTALHKGAQIVFAECQCGYCRHLREKDSSDV